MLEPVSQSAWLQLIVSHLAALLAGMFLCLAIMGPDTPPKRGPNRP